MGKLIIKVIDDAFLLSGDIDLIQNNQRVKSNFQSIGATFSNSGEVIISFDDENSRSREEIYEKIKYVLEKFNFEYNQSNETKLLLDEFNRNKLNFEEFSRKARDIRNNIHEGNYFQEFANVIRNTLKRSLYTHQLLSAYHLASSQNACNFSVPGAGKTSIVYAAYAYLKSMPIESDKQVKRMLVICPPAAFFPWKDEYEKCFGEKPTIKELAGVDGRSRADYFLSLNPKEITLISYHSAARDVTLIKNFLKKHKDVMVVLDEAHKIKNTSEEASWANAILSFAKDAKARVVLTGTPAPNSYGDLWNLYKFIYPHEQIIKFPLNFLTNLSQPEDKKTLIESISPFFIRIRKEDLELPMPIYHEPIFVSMDSEQENIYNHIENSYINSIGSDKNNQSFRATLQKAKLIRLRQCLTNPSLLNKSLDEYLKVHQEANGVAQVDDVEIFKSIENYRLTPPKYIKVSDLITEKIMPQHGADGKVIIWACFIGNIECLAQYLRSKNINCETLYGATPIRDDGTDENIVTREKIIADFHREDCQYRVIIANPFAVGESISLHKACHNAIYLEKDFNATNYIQSKDRIHRYGLKKDDVINYYSILSEGTIDSAIHERVLEKEKQMLDIIESEEIPLLQMDMSGKDGIENEDIGAIIDDYHFRKPS